MKQPASAAKRSAKPFEGFSRDEVIAQLIAEMEAQAPREDEFAAVDFARQAGLPMKKATYQLECLVTSGRLQRRKGLMKGRAVWLYSSANQDSGI